MRPRWEALTKGHNRPLPDSRDRQLGGTLCWSRRLRDLEL
jgi:hypothetical protein